MACCKGHSKQSGETCVECEIPQLTRNNYFTGKLLVERDFTDEQRFFLGKERRHNQYLHGCGTVCGLRVKPHPNVACQSQYVVVEAGYAVDCCGHEILVRDEANFDFRGAFEGAWNQLNGTTGKIPDSDTYKLQICLSYNECGTEPLPSLFDECGCDEQGCQPNRVLESYHLGVILNAKDKVEDPLGVTLAWDETISKVANPARVTLGKDTIFILTADATIVAASTANGAVTGAQSFAAATGIDIALSADGTLLFAAVLAQGDSDPKILVLDPAALSTAPSATLPLTGAGNGQVRLAPTADGALYVASQAQNKLFAFDASQSPLADIAIGASPVAVVAGTGGYLYTVNTAGAGVSAVKLADGTVNPLTLPSGATPAALDVTATSAGDNLAILDTAAKTMYLVGWRPAATPNTVAIGDPVTSFGKTPLTATFSPGGSWIYVLEQDGATKAGAVEPFSVAAIKDKHAHVHGDAAAVGVQPAQLANAANGEHLYVAYTGGAPTPGGVAVLDVSEQACCGILDRVLDPCPTCASADCLVLATIPKYTYNSPVSSGIDNKTGRPILPSATLLADAIECLCKEKAKPGPVGPAGPAGPSALDPHLTHIVAVNWTHAAESDPKAIQKVKGLVIAFDHKVHAGDIHAQSFLVRTAANEIQEKRPPNCWCEVAGKPRGVNVTVAGTPPRITAINTDPVDASATVTGAWFPMNVVAGATYRVTLMSNYIRDENKKAIDGDHLPGWVPARPSGDKIEGGTFESWFFTPSNA